MSVLDILHEACLMDISPIYAFEAFSIYFRNNLRHGIFATIISNSLFLLMEAYNFNYEQASKFNSLEPLATF